MNIKVNYGSYEQTIGFISSLKELDATFQIIKEKAIEEGLK